MAEFGISELTLGVIIGALVAIIYSLRVIVMMDRRIERMEMHLERIANKLVSETSRIEKKLKIRR